MKCKFESTVNVGEIELPWARISSSKDDKYLSISTREYDLFISPTKVRIKYVIHRPDHDHDNWPEITFEVPENGIVEGKSKGILTVQDDSDHLNLDMRYNNYVWKRGLHLVVQEYYDKELHWMAIHRGLKVLLDKLGISEDEYYRMMIRARANDKLRQELNKG